jgi:predicted PurR-regulated permease PerM
VIFVVMAISLFILHQITGHVPYWLILAFMAGFLEIVPFVGPFVSGAIAVLLILNVSFWIALIVAVIYLVVQQLESNILVPKVMQKSVGLNPLVAILAVVVGSRLAGIMGAVIAIPIAASLQVFLQDVMPAKKEVEEEEVRN